MSNRTSVIRLHPNGDPENGMTPGDWECDLIEGNPKKSFHRFFEARRESMGEMRVGVVEGHAYTEKVVDYPCDEMCLVLEGSVIVIDEDGHEEVFEKGDCLFMPRGFSGFWKQSDNFKKYHMTVCR